MVNELVKEGLLPASHAEALLHDIALDKQAIEHDRVAEWRKSGSPGRGRGTEEPLLP